MLFGCKKYYFTIKKYKKECEIKINFIYLSQIFHKQENSFKNIYSD